jgi:hypothetical protein
MKYFRIIICTVIISILFLECNNKGKSDNTLQNAINEMINIGINSEFITDTIFLDFRFGMSEKECDEHIKKLQDVDKIWIENELKWYRFTFNPSSQVKSATGYFLRDFYKDELYNLKVIVWADNFYNSNPTKYVREQLKELVEAKYGKTYSEKYLDDSEIIHCFVKNLHIKIFDITDKDVILEYTDLKRQQMKEKYELQESKEKYEKSVNDV